MTTLILLDPLPEGVDDHSTVYLAVTQRDRRHVSGAGLIRIEGAPLGEEDVYYSLLADYKTWGRTEGVLIENCRFYYCPVGIQFDTFVPKGIIETAIVRDIIHREGPVLASILDTGNTNSVMFDNITIWPDDYRLPYTQNHVEKPGTSFSLVWKDTRGFPMLVGGYPGSSNHGRFEMTMAIGGSHFFSNLSLHAAEYGIVCNAGMQDSYNGVMGDGITEAIFWFNYKSWGHVANNIVGAWVGRIAKIQGESVAIQFNAVNSVDLADFAREAILIGKGSFAMSGAWFGRKNMAHKRGEGILFYGARNNGVTEIAPPKLSCADVASVNYTGRFGYRVQPLFGPFLPAFGCSIYHNGSGFSDPTPPRPSPESDPVAQCLAPRNYSYIGKISKRFIDELAAAGLHTWGYNSNVPYPCTGNDR